MDFVVFEAPKKMFILDIATHISFAVLPITQHVAVTREQCLLTATLYFKSTLGQILRVDSITILFVHSSILSITSVKTHDVYTNTV